MTSTVTNYSKLIDPTYPVSGADNDIRGFSDNFLKIKSALETASQEITDIQANGMYTSNDNDFNDQGITSATIVNCTIVLRPRTSA